MGHSFVHWASKRAEARIYSKNLGLDRTDFKVMWHRKRGMVWSDLFNEFGILYLKWPAPDILILHLGGKDLGKVKTLNLIYTIRDNLLRFHFSSLGTVLIFSEMIPRLKWLNSNFLRPLEKVRKRVNRAIQTFLSSLRDLLLGTQN